MIALAACSPAISVTPLPSATPAPVLRPITLPAATPIPTIPPTTFSASTVPPTITVTATPEASPTQAPTPQVTLTATPFFSVTVAVEAEVTRLRVGEILTLTVTVQNHSRDCQYPLYEVWLPQLEESSLFEAVSPPKLGPPGPNPATFTLKAIRPGTMPIKVQAYGERYCYDAYVWHTLSGVSKPVTVEPEAAPLPSLDFAQGSWQMGTSMPQPARSEMPAVTIDDWIYVPGGFGDPARLDRYNPETDQWQTLAQLPAGRHHLMAAAYGGKLYLFGGAPSQSWEPTATVWVYDPVDDTWQELPPMPEPRLAGAAVTLNDKIYIAGGAGGSQALLEFTPEQASWRLLSAPGQAREHVSAVVYEAEIWLLGGRWFGEGELASVEIYTPVTDTWRNGPPMQVPRAGFAAAVVDEHIIVAGGEVIFTGTDTLDSVEILASGSTTWQMGPALGVPIHGVGGAAFDRRFLLLGGSIRAGAIENEGQVQIYVPLE